MADDPDWTTAPMPDLVREQHRLVVELEEIQAMYRKLAESELIPIRARLDHLRIIARARMVRDMPKPDDSRRWWA